MIDMIDLMGDTQLRAMRTRIKILRAIVKKNGSACFSEIRTLTGLSTGSIYYHLERMKNYVLKNSKYYEITKEGIDLLIEIDKKKDFSLSTRII
ncbi:MAG: winged helix-turn-helix domain-containing protein [Candidatus Nitrosocosmicus sp.]|jgi:predicted transcriptional regulator|uniref:winged helix-turn-helix domain-containing protein n=1 Tax=Candidatus Nitrosocosmicus agrestis TaxID=2563600 RepID=UPI00122E4714|nr:winged helix-turn-helix domain-containing protein [Candidatus Nitrosocosmicus sp. SS]KAA2281158.1 winged helix-turn-helix transcriptional regulator [Candidatus Nitrosocosmicus sp. SS]KAF0869458.1 winged helix-turn-helix transcriptional regulator [Candidatus Nitrosocosmicus sp. SS]MDR4491841.1 winged helix-turn-helix domain-containing protein [Candidatus Nitrosocosmicus sp.]HET6590052.1 winged helix-turn-helix domain-containing protein [Candidatus Nitrosocosmicus sp.]